MFKKRFIGICGSLRKNSRNMGLLRAAAEAMPQGSSLEIADITNIPFYREDMPLFQIRAFSQPLSFLR